jgi:hypothetical protein
LAKGRKSWWAAEVDDCLFLDDITADDARWGRSVLLVGVRRSGSGGENRQRKIMTGTSAEGGGELVPDASAVLASRRITTIMGHMPAATYTLTH